MSESKRIKVKMSEARGKVEGMYAIAPATSLNNFGPKGVCPDPIMNILIKILEFLPDQPGKDWQEKDIIQTWIAVEPQEGTLEGQRLELQYDRDQEIDFWPEGMQVEAKFEDWGQSS